MADMNEFNQVTFQTLRHNANIWYSWGVPFKNAMVYDNETNAITFKVNGWKFKHKVRVTYDRGSDLYKIEFLKPVREKLQGTRKFFIVGYEAQETYTEVYGEDLVRLIDEYIES